MRKSQMRIALGTLAAIAVLAYGFAGHSMSAGHDGLMGSAAGAAICLLTAAVTLCATTRQRPAPRYSATIDSAVAPAPTFPEPPETDARERASPAVLQRFLS